jgi:hypothetical protein
MHETFDSLVAVLLVKHWLPPKQLQGHQSSNSSRNRNRNACGTG